MQAAPTRSSDARVRNRAPTVCAAAAGLVVAASLSAAEPLPAQQLCDRINPCVTSYVEPHDYDLGTTLGRRGANVAIGATINTLIAVLNDQPLVPSLLRSLGVSLGFEIAMMADSHLTIDRGYVTPFGHVVGRITSSLSANIVRGAPLCEDVRTGWLLLELTYDCGDVALGATLTPLLGATYFALAGGELDVANTVALGVPVFELPRDGSPIVGLAAGGAIGYEPRPVAYTVDEIEGLRPQLALNDPVQVRHLYTLLDWARHAERNPRLKVTFVHERRHTTQLDYLEKALAAFDPPWYVHDRVELLPRVHIDIAPAAIAAIWLVTVIQGPDDIPWEYPARVDEQGVVLGGGEFLAIDRGDSFELRRRR